MSLQQPVFPGGLLWLFFSPPNIYLFTYLAVSGLSCVPQTLSSSLQHAGICFRKLI